MQCAECDTEIEQSPTQLVQDYLCPACRAASDPEDWDDRKRVMDAISEWLTSRGQMFYGHEVMFPELSPWAWVRIYDDPGLASPERVVSHSNFSSHAVLNEYLERLKVPLYVVWKRTGCVYEIGADGVVPDDPIFVPSWA